MQCPLVISYSVDVSCPGPLLTCSITSVTLVFSHTQMCVYIYNYISIYIYHLSGLHNTVVLRSAHFIHLDIMHNNVSL